LLVNNGKYRELANEVNDEKVLREVNLIIEALKRAQLHAI
jgi:hypothetical protein